ncbi:ABC transporter ATP-binding protein [Treponema putidum]|uniref:ABC transporter ATP-binding protein n=1 Tax=Treponema putidum TaxID=221027 RepID=A0AAE9MSB8_9SPIR|nr:ABC transporter ATP-binding protein [Treponema putidum]UTY33204.1 ABC transporter ATP-binding protein [Treponema putidum]
MSNTVIKAEHLSKYYRLGVINNGTLFRDIQTWIALKRCKPDPHSKIGEHKYDGTDEGFWALKDLNFEIKQGDRVGIIGKNGAGKSTLLKILSRITAPTEGCVKVSGRVASLLEVGTGFHGELTGRENIYLNGAILGMKKKEVDRKIDEIIDFSGIEKHIDTPVKRYSSGMYVRLAFAVAAHLDSDILIADEVLAVGDADFQKKALGKMNELSAGQGRTVLFVSHNMPAIKALCNKGIILDKGRLRFESNSIDKVLDVYSGKNKNQDIRLRWNNDGSIKNMYFTPKSVNIVDSMGTAINYYLDYESAYKIVLEANIEEVLPNIDFWILVYRDNVSLFALKGENHDLHIGMNVFEFYIYPRMLPPGSYDISLSLSIKNTAWIVNPDEHSVSIYFSVSSKNSDIWKSKQIK